LEVHTAEGFSTVLAGGCCRMPCGNQLVVVEVTDLLNSHEAFDVFHCLPEVGE